MEGSLYKFTIILNIVYIYDRTVSLSKFFNVVRNSICLHVLWSHEF